MPEALDRKLREYCEKEKIGGVMRITQKDTVVYETAFGLADREKGIPFDARSVFTFYSMTKPFCAFGLLRLADKGLLSLSDHPGKALPEAAGLHPATTWRNLLYHTSGMPDPVQDALFPGEPYPVTSEECRAVLKRIGEKPALWEPNTKPRYSNCGYVLSALAIENLSGLSFADYMKKEIFEPLEMESVIDRPGLSIPNRVVGYQLDPDGTLRPARKDFRWMLGAGDMLGRLDDAFVLRRILRERLILKEDTWKAVLTPCPLNGMGLGCSLKPFYGKEQIRHNGGSAGFRTLHVYLPREDFDLVFLSNSGFGDARKDMAAIINRYFFGESGGADDTPMDTGYIQESPSNGSCPNKRA